MASADPAHDTIAAIATPSGRGGIGVVRVSGSGVAAIAETVAGSLPEPRRATLVTMRDARGDALDQGIVIYFPGPHSYTGEPVLELQGHGGPVVLATLLSACVGAGARIAEPGEFTRRAFLNGRLDLAQAEAVADLIEASTEQAARSAVRSLSGEFSSAINALVSQLIYLRALTEAMLDFPEEDIDDAHLEDIGARLAQVTEALALVFARSRQGSLFRSGINVVIAGRPNVGKSSLLNRLAGEERAIVTSVPGTTRDSVRELIAIRGVPLNIVDTAGLREAADEVERLGIERTRLELERADVVLLVTEASALLTEEDQNILASLPRGPSRIHVLNKVDLAGIEPALREGEMPEVLVSAKTGAGIDLLRAAMLQAAGWESTDDTVYVARERHLRALAKAGEHLAEAAAQQRNWPFFAEELRLAHQSLCTITGEFSADDLLGEIFSRFCIGK